VCWLQQARTQAPAACVPACYAAPESNEPISPLVNSITLTPNFATEVAPPSPTFAACNTTHSSGDRPTHHSPFLALSRSFDDTNSSGEWNAHLSPYNLTIPSHYSPADTISADLDGATQMIHPPTPHLAHAPVRSRPPPMDPSQYGPPSRPPMTGFHSGTTDTARSAPIRRCAFRQR